MAGQDLAVKTNFIPTGDGVITTEEIREQMKGIQLAYPRIRIPAGGALQFEIPNPDDPDRPEYAEELTGVIVYHTPSNAYWPYEGMQSPQCSALDGENGIGDPGGECQNCPLNRFGSGEGGRGKACKNMHRIYLLRPNEAIPVLLTLPATSLKAWGNYLGLSLLGRGMYPSGVVTRIRLKRETGRDGANTYSTAVFSIAEKFPDREVTREVMDYAKTLKEQICANTSQTTTLEAAGAIPDTPDSEMPF